ncbi:hypothetical protein SCP_0603070 [Sparassis crispa]|uniref:Uncharacterized protein n=1 Tax=Sparassis crispa TaxID=139825 RepID=A0A401GQA4_9APHY|nr:hypothetical protein SCP_0603070 [Sparassis crispa]GBE84329.1 hypothetical protein SCP_0603070 [Sparassis crispa]
MSVPASPTLVNGVPSRAQTPFIRASSPSPSIKLSHASDEQEFATRLISAIRVPVDFTDILVALQNRPQDRQAVVSMQRALEMVEWMQTARQELIAAEERMSRARTRVDQVWSLMRSTVTRTAQEIWREHGDEDIGHILGYTTNGIPASTPLDDLHYRNHLSRPHPLLHIAVIPTGMDISPNKDHEPTGGHATDAEEIIMSATAPDDDENHNISCGTRNVRRELMLQRSSLVAHLFFSFSLFPLRYQTT